MSSHLPARSCRARPVLLSSISLPLHRMPLTEGSVTIPFNRDTFARPRFKRADLPPTSFFASQLRPPLISTTTTKPLPSSSSSSSSTPIAKACHRALDQYLNLALSSSSGSRAWRDKLPVSDAGAGRSTPSLATLHTAATAMILGPRGPAWHMALHVLHTGALRGYAPSVLTLVRFGLRARQLGQPQFEVAEAALRRLAEGGYARLKRLPAASKEEEEELGISYLPDACTLLGLVHAARDTRKDDDLALLWFRRAVETNSVTAEEGEGEGVEEGVEEDKEDKDGSSSSSSSITIYDRWQWRESCLLGAAKIRLKRGEPIKAEPLLRHAADVLDSAEACRSFAMLIGDTDPRSRLYLTKAAVSGDTDACREMGKRETKRADGEDLSEWEYKRSLAFADEWMAMVGDKGQI
ncbi:hypothetical protein F4775DRAFT_559345 [Biscogniauxia sp. FL1348]|nr:hypothetical protein F4775DRAFT_559345 [Biscogniauxia sp. FL1348]